MEKFNNSIDNGKNDIVFTKKVNAGKRVYYIDVKRNKNDDLFLAITESKKIIDEKAEEVVFEKHKIFLYKEDFDKFISALNESLDYIKEHKFNATYPERNSFEPESMSLKFNY